MYWPEECVQTFRPASPRGSSKFRRSAGFCCVRLRLDAEADYKAHKTLGFDRVKKRPSVEQLGERADRVRNRVKNPFINLRSISVVRHMLDT